jgi:hypothetical protein
MFKTITLTLALTITSALAFSQDSTKNSSIITEIQECKCSEIIMISSKVEKTYTREWLEGIELKGGMIAFTKGNVVHKWNPEQIIFIENGGHFIRIYLN